MPDEELGQIVVHPLEQDDVGPFRADIVGKPCRDLHVDFIFWVISGVIRDWYNAVEYLGFNDAAAPHAEETCVMPQFAQSLCDHCLSDFAMKFGGCMTEQHKNFHGTRYPVLALAVSVRPDQRVAC